MRASPGEKITPYEIVAPIGAGGMGEVFRAHDRRLGRAVAIKVSGERFSDRFERSASGCGAESPQHLRSYDVGLNYLVMEHIEGETLAGPLPLEETLRIARQLADALEAADEKGIVHRDLKPANIKIKADGTVKNPGFWLSENCGSRRRYERRLADQRDGSRGHPRHGSLHVSGTGSWKNRRQARRHLAFDVILYELLSNCIAVTQ